MVQMVLLVLVDLLVPVYQDLLEPLADLADPEDQLVQRLR